jgi:hypothetical protein
MAADRDDIETWRWSHGDVIPSSAAYITPTQAVLVWTISTATTATLLWRHGAWLLVPSRDPHLGKETYLARRDRCSPLSSLSPICSSAQSVESARLQRFTFNVLNVSEIEVLLVWRRQAFAPDAYAPIGGRWARRVRRHSSPLVVGALTRHVGAICRVIGRHCLRRCRATRRALSAVVRLFGR